MLPDYDNIRHKQNSHRMSYGCFFLSSCFSLYPEVHGTLEIFKVFLIAAHRLAGIVGELSYRSAVYILELDDNIKCPSVSICPILSTNEKSMSLILGIFS